VVDDTPIISLPTNPTITQIKSQNEEMTKKQPKVKSLIYNSTIDCLFYRIMTYKTAKESWYILKEEGSDGTHLSTPDFVRVIF